MYKYLLATLICFGLLTGCATSPVKPLYPAESGKLKTIEVRVSAPKEAISVRHFMQTTTVNPIVGQGPYVGAGILGAVIGAAIVDAVRNEKERQKANELRLEISGLTDQVAGMDYSSLLTKDLADGLMRLPLGKISKVTPDDRPLSRSEKNTAAILSASDAVLFVEVAHSFSHGGIHPLKGTPPMPRVALDMDARVLLLSRNGEELLNDRIVFVTPSSSIIGNAEHLDWWLDNQRFRSLLGLSGPAFAAALVDELLASSRYADEAAFNARRVEDKGADAARRPGNFTKDGKVFGRCDDFFKISPHLARFDFVRPGAEGPLYVGLACTAPDTRAQGPTVPAGSPP